MTDHIYLEGSEEVGRAGAAIRAAVFNMQGAADTIDSAVAALIQHQSQMIERFENVVEKLISVVQTCRVSKPDVTNPEVRRPSRFDDSSSNISQSERGRDATVGFERVVEQSQPEDEAA